MALKDFGSRVLKAGDSMSGDLDMQTNETVYEEQTTPANPTANKIKLYAKDDGAGVTALFTLDSAGSEVKLASSMGDAPSNAQYVTLALNATLTNERVLTGTANQISITDGGAGGNVTLSTPQNIHTGATPTFASLTLSGLTANSFLFSGTAGLLTSTSAPTNGQLLIGSTGLAPVAAALTGTTNQVNVTNAAGSITLSTPQNIHTTADVIFKTVSVPVNALAAGFMFFGDGTGPSAPTGTPGVRVYAGTTTAWVGESLFIIDSNGRFADLAEWQAAPVVTVGAAAGFFNERTLTGTTNRIAITDNGAESTVVLSTPQDIHTGARPTFSGLLLAASGTPVANALIVNNPTAIAAVAAGDVLAGGSTTVFQFDQSARNITLKATGTSCLIELISDTSVGLLQGDAVSGGYIGLISQIANVGKTEIRARVNLWDFLDISGAAAAVFSVRIPTAGTGAILVNNITPAATLAAGDIAAGGTTSIFQYDQSASMLILRGTGTTTDVTLSRSAADTLQIGSGDTFDMNSNKIINVTDPTAAQDAATKAYADTLIQIGMIVMWSNASGTSALNAKWSLCDGSVVAGITTPDLRAKFVQGANSLTAGDLNATTSTSTHSHTVNSHTHGVGTYVIGAPSATTPISTGLFTAATEDHIHTITGASAATAPGTSSDSHIPPSHKVAFIMRTT